MSLFIKQLQKTYSICSEPFGLTSNIGTVKECKGKIFFSGQQFKHRRHNGKDTDTACQPEKVKRNTIKT